MGILSSSFASLIASFIYFVSSFFLDKELTPNQSNIISSILSVSMDVILQSYFFKKPDLDKKIDIFCCIFFASILAFSEKFKQSLA